MSEAEMGLLILVALAVLFALVAHAVSVHKTMASVVSGGLASLVFQVLVYFDLGYLDPFFLIAFVVGWFLAFIVAFMIGVIVQIVRMQGKAPRI